MGFSHLGASEFAMEAVRVTLCCGIYGLSGWARTSCGSGKLLDRDQSSELFSIRGSRKCVHR